MPIMAPALLHAAAKEETLMTRWFGILAALVLVVAVGACTGPDDETGHNNPDDQTFALTNTTHYNPEGLLRGQGLKIYTDVPMEQLEPARAYNVEVTNDNTDELLAAGDFITDEDQTITPYDLLFDVGQYNDVEEGDNIRVTVSDDEGLSITSIISLAALRLPGWDVSEVSAPEVYVCDASGNPANAFAVGGQDPGEVVGPVYVRGTGFPEVLAGRTVDVYIVESRENWMGELIPASGETFHVFGPTAVTIDAAGNLPATDTGFTPAEGDVGTYDVLVDTDANGEMDWGMNVKDGGDGIDEQVGFTVQYSAAWIRARGQRHILVNMAYSSDSRDTLNWSNTYARDQVVYSYLNPPVMHQYHFSVTKWVVRHQDFATYWNNQALETGPGGCIPFAEHTVQNLGVPIQQGCTNSGPVHWGPAALLLDDTDNDAFDVVFDRNGDGCYAPGEDLLDVIGGANATGDLVTWEQFQTMDPADQVGFRVLP